MKMKYVSKIQASLNGYKVIPTNKLTNCVLDGSYASVYKGKSMNFDELREYVVGDDVKDIDWKASSRSGKVLVRQFIAEKKHNIMFVFDTNRRMLADGGDNTEKRELAVMAAGTLALLVNRNNDYISAAYQAGEQLRHSPFRTGLGNIELMLEEYHAAVTMENRSDINRTLEYLIRHFRRRMILFLVTDLEGIRSISEANLRYVCGMNDLLVLCVQDADFGAGMPYDLGEDAYLDDFFAKDKKLKRVAREERQKLKTECEKKLARYGIACAGIDSLSGMEKEIMRMLEQHKFEKR